MCPGCLTQVETGDSPSSGGFLDSGSPFELESSPTSSSAPLPASGGKRPARVQSASGERRQKWEQAKKRKKKKRYEKRQEESSSGIASWGGTLLFLSIGSMLLPLVGVQFKILALFGPFAPIVGVLFGLVGIGMLIIGNPHWSAGKMLAIGFGLAALLVVFGLLPILVMILSAAGSGIGGNAASSFQQNGIRTAKQLSNDPSVQPNNPAEFNRGPNPKIFDRNNQSGRGNHFDGSGMDDDPAFENHRKEFGKQGDFLASHEERVAQMREQAKKDREEFMERFKSSPFRQGNNSSSTSASPSRNKSPINSGGSSKNGSPHNNSSQSIKRPENSDANSASQDDSSDESPFVIRKSAPNNRNQRNSRGDDADDDNPLARRSKPNSRNQASESSDSAEGDTAAMDADDNPFSGGKSIDDAVPFRPIPDLDNPFQPKSSSSDTAVDAIDRNQLSPSSKSDISRRFLSEGTSVSIFNSRGIPGFSKKFKLSDIAGKKTKSGQVFVSDKPTTGLIFFRSGRLSYFVPMTVREKRTLDAVMPLDDEGLHGLNVGIVDGKIVGVQGVFCDVDRRKLVVSSAREGEWIGDEPAPKNIVSIDGGGKRIHGMVVFTRGFDLQGLRLITGPR